MIKLLFVLAPGLALTAVYFVAAQVMCRGKLDRAVGIYIKLAGIALVGLILLLAIGQSISGYETLANTLKQFVHWLRS